MSGAGVAIIGGGFTGTMLAVALAERGVPVTLIAGKGEPGRGLAYGADNPIFRLNVRANRMSAFADRPDDFVAWLAGQGIEGVEESFQPRHRFGDYVTDRLQQAMARCRPLLTVIRERAVDIIVGSPQGVRLASDRVIPADRVVLALGNPPPRPLPGTADLPRSLYRNDPWDGPLGEGLSAEDSVLLVGTGLTMVDAALALTGEGFAGRIIALSRRGLLPRPQPETALGPISVPLAEKLAGHSLSAMARIMRETARSEGWVAAIDSLRPVTQELWAGASSETQARFLRVLRPWWDVHRHRLAAELHARLMTLCGEGQLTVRAGRIRRIERVGAALSVTIAPRGSSGEARLVVRRIVNCTGPALDITDIDDPLVQSLMAQGRIAADRHRIGLAVEEDLRVTRADGRPDDTLFAAGPITRSRFWEVVAVPDIRGQVAELADRLARTHTDCASP